MVILPSSLMMSTSFTLREVAFISLFSLPFGGGDAAPLRAVLGHDQRGAAAGMERVVDRVHERFHVEDAAPAGLHQILLVERVAHHGGVESFSLVRDGDLELGAAKIEGG